MLFVKLKRSLAEITFLYKKLAAALIFFISFAYTNEGKLLEIIKNHFPDTLKTIKSRSSGLFLLPDCLRSGHIFNFPSIESSIVLPIMAPVTCLAKATRPPCFVSQ